MFSPPTSSAKHSLEVDRKGVPLSMKSYRSAQTALPNPIETQAQQESTLNSACLNILSHTTFSKPTFQSASTQPKFIGTCIICKVCSRDPRLPSQPPPTPYYPKPTLSPNGNPSEPANEPSSKGYMYLKDDATPMLLNSSFDSDPQLRIASMVPVYSVLYNAPNSITGVDVGNVSSGLDLLGEVVNTQCISPRNRTSKETTTIVEVSEVEIPISLEACLQKIDTRSNQTFTLFQASTDDPNILPSRVNFIRATDPHLPNIPIYTYESWKPLACSYYPLATLARRDVYVTIPLHLEPRTPYYNGGASPWTNYVYSISTRNLLECATLGLVAYLRTRLLQYNNADITNTLYIPDIIRRGGLIPFHFILLDGLVGKFIAFDRNGNGHGSPKPPAPISPHIFLHHPNSICNKEPGTSAVLEAAIAYGVFGELRREGGVLVMQLRVACVNAESGGQMLFLIRNPRVASLSNFQLRGIHTIIQSFISHISPLNNPFPPISPGLTSTV
ncbi:uncharacterized protein BDR25DRAFT_362470 [Lindgomyces ingoldianus]|uniref:Uncharacterized protein n=1 Tax=Lindgomyces ingoldianus TaxID=673940 RepID=A0ACB6QBB8_9PLEO|nr:uncharacterized protein BDR25DRAFT_362470 [Lindgomyces ingoldianus]KAF2463795.1 hypothetical protein BDR25DRAFT_362470 [Lindgomyces ingoldianus]